MAKHFSKEVGGVVCEENEIPDWDLIEKKNQEFQQKIGGKT